MVTRLILIAMFLISAAPAKHAAYQRCITIDGPPLDQDSTHPIEGNAPVSSLS